jgi:hypothetical protein
MKSLRFRGLLIHAHPLVQNRQIEMPPGRQDRSAGAPESEATPGGGARPNEQFQVGAARLAITSRKFDSYARGKGAKLGSPDG